MLTRTFLCVILLVAVTQLFAQERPEEDAVIQPMERRVSHYLGLQANQLIRNLVSFGGTSTIVSNPYLLVYSVNSKTSGVGFSTGLGVSSIQTKTNDNFITTTSKVNDFALRMGIEAKKYLSRRWLFAYGWDMLAEGNKTSITSTITGGNPQPEITNTIYRVGTGPRVGLNFQFHEKLMIGTEASYYFKWIDQKSKQSSQGGAGTVTSTTDTKLQQFQFTVPAVIFLIMKF